MMVGTAIINNAKQVQRCGDPKLNNPNLKPFFTFAMRVVFLIGTVYRHPLNVVNHRSFSGGVNTYA
jgi:hypothetical protein